MKVDLVKKDRPLSVLLVPELLVDNLEEYGIRIYGNIHPTNNHYPDSIKARFREHKDNSNITWIQEGDLHCCVRDYLRAELNELKGRGRWPDYHHEHVCVSDGYVQSLLKQIKVIEVGRKLIIKELGIQENKLENYCAANHLCNDDTLNALRQLDSKSCIVRNGFNYIPAVGGYFILPAYRSVDSVSKGLVVIPESMLGEGNRSPLIGSYYDRLGDGRQSWDGFLEILDCAVPLSKIIDDAKEKDWKHNISEKIVYSSKKFRDFRKRFT